LLPPPYPTCGPPGHLSLLQRASVFASSVYGLPFSFALTPGCSDQTPSGPAAPRANPFRLTIRLLKHPFLRQPAPNPNIVVAGSPAARAVGSAHSLASSSPLKVRALTQSVSPEAPRIATASPIRAVASFWKRRDLGSSTIACLRVHRVPSPP
jgi:hypothetical protein